MSTPVSARSGGSPSDRQRDRENRSTAAAAGARAGGRLPSPPRQRRPALAALAVLLIVGGAAIAGLLALRADDRVPVLVARQDIAVGAQITRDDLAVARIASENVQYIRSSQAASIEGKYASQGITQGQLLTPTMVGGSGFLTAGKAAVGVSLEAGKVPASGLQSGDVVEVFQVKSGSPVAVLADRATVSSVPTGSGSSGSSGTGGNGGAVNATLIVDQSEAQALVAAASDGEVAVALLQRGGNIGAG
jgi:Flp pilus assembly protein CpaB